MERTLLVIICLSALCGCATKLNKTIPPTVSTAAVVASLSETKIELEDAGKSNTKVAVHVDKALDLAEQLDALLEKIEKEQLAKSDFKSFKK